MNSKFEKVMYIYNSLNFIDQVYTSDQIYS